MAWQPLEQLNVVRDPVEDYLLLGTGDLLPQNIRELQAMQHDIATSRLKFRQSLYYRGWIALELADINEGMGRDQQAERDLLFGHKLFEEIMPLQRTTTEKINLNRVLATTEAHLSVVSSRIERSTLDLTPIQQYLGSLATFTYDLMDEMPRTDYQLLGLATEITFASLVLDIPTDKLALPITGTPRQECPHSLDQSKKIPTRMNRARDYTVATYDKTLRIQERHPIQIKTNYSDEDAERYHESVKFISASSHMNTDCRREAYEMAEALSVNRSNRGKTITRKIELAQQNIMDEIGIKL